MKLGDSMDKKLFKSILLLITYTVVLVMVLSRLGLIAGGVAWVLGLVKPLLIGFALAFRYISSSMAGESWFRNTSPI